MSFSISSRSPSYRLPELELPKTPTFSSTPTETLPELDTSQLLNLFSDAFSTEPSSPSLGDPTGQGGGLDQLLETAKQLVQTLEQLTELLQAPEIGEQPPAGGQQPESFFQNPEGGPGGPQGGPGGPQGTNGPQGAGEAPKGQVGDWIKEAQQKLAAAGIPADKMKAEDIAKIIQHESSGDPNAINQWDDNAKKGTPSIGLMQTIQPTFDAYKLPGHDNIRDPVDNIIAGVRYAVDRYGSVSNVPGLQSMNGGGGYVGY
ncbi:Phage tail length tape-measure protein [Cystobacter fuscus DSM 2262]|uniref:Phage tail length tape-measure protein n=1 Tax=Cystobacter fuscus (strain ATCC 25194 / DSM 2262 / NBRC 100088 / M29) TaxID=1242864 RepID=S9P1B4_CYSF2|nr:transglycosylase SLT domain-containing protein [Cystobacter fuscus]EPX56921.1 Phage tail length tape-measure protein [Cystobacter fuscus DSM 2262]